MNFKGICISALCKYSFSFSHAAIYRVQTRYANYSGDFVFFCLFFLSILVDFVTFHRHENIAYWT